MFHLLKKYAKLLKLKPETPAGAVLNQWASSGDGLRKIFMEQSMVKSPGDVLIPCIVPPPYDPNATLREKKR